MGIAEWNGRQPRITALADDATGALETGCRLNANGVPSRVWLIPPPPERCSAVVNTQSRHCTPSEARARIRQVLKLIREPGWIFKKTDSTLRGNIAPEIAEVFDHCDCRAFIYAPAYPAMGRTVVQGRLFVHGMPVEQTAFSRDPLFPVRRGSILELFQHYGLEAMPVSRPCELGSLVADAGRRRVLICDGATEDDIDEAARAVACSGGAVAAAGPAPFAGALARQLSLGRTCCIAPQPAARRGLIVCGSLHPASLNQVEYAVAFGIPMVATAAQAAIALTRRNWIILSPLTGTDLQPHQAGEKIAQAVREVIEKTALDTLVIFGGETAYTILQHLKVRYVEPERELLTGVSISRAPSPHRLTVVAKAGGFGPPTVIPDLLQQLLGRQQARKEAPGKRP